MNNVSVKEEMINPDQASLYLSALSDKQRKLSKEQLSFLSRAMKTGRWVYDGSPLQFDWNGKLLNGQHRLNAVIDSGTTQKFLVVRGIDPAAYSVMDQGRSRSGRETAAMLGTTNASSAAIIAKVLCRMKYGLEIDRTRVDNSEIADFIEANKEALEWSASRARRIALSPDASIGSALFLLYHSNPVKAEEFADKLATGVGLAHDSPVLALKNRLEQHAKSKSRLELNRTSNLLPIIIHVFECFAKNRPLTRIATLKEPRFYPSNIAPEFFWEDK